MNRKYSLLRAGSFAAFSVSGLLIVITVIAQLSGIDYLKIIGSYFCGNHPLPLPKLLQCLALFRTSLVIDFFLITGQIIAWLGILVLLQKKYGIAAFFIFIAGIIGPVFDFVQNSMEWALIQALEQNTAVQPNWYFSWTVATQLSFLLAFASSSIASVLLFRGSRLNMLFGIAGTVLLIPAVIGLYFSDLGIFTLLWYLIWYILAALLLNQANATSATSGND